MKISVFFTIILLIVQFLLQVWYINSNWNNKKTEENIELTVNKPIKYPPGNYELKQNIPNPFNSNTIIEFCLPVQNYNLSIEEVHLSIYNLYGNEISLLVNGQLTAGSYNVLWNASEYPGGIYYYALTTKNYICSKKMILVK